MNQYTETITVHIQLTTYGDALIYGDSSMNYSISGQILKQRLFAWHEASFYGTELEIQHVQDTDIILLPSEQVIPFLAERELLKHIEWIWDEANAPWLRLIPLLAHCIEAKAYVPSFTAFQAGSCNGSGMRKHWKTSNRQSLLCSTAWRRTSRKG